MILGSKWNKQSRRKEKGVGGSTVLPYQYNETNVIYFVLSLLRIKGVYMFRAILAHPQEALHKRHLV
jgi:hypothetical protein